ncbi:hypothetical protein MKZ38_002474 [Zalerion maritima]|uniref:Uncharacterized protein n=1 Tax=Zalerion maritima TaxID=339359 RepID=A0AAD5RPN1_9PEZI|nr:hypothetical protein MKZ38_002474 [Zalerion maritima]
MLLGTTVVVAGLAVVTGANQLDITDQIRRDLGFNLYPRVGATDLQTFSGALGGASAPAIQNSGDTARPFMVDGDTFTDFQTAANRACDNQKNECADLANNGGGEFEVGDCDSQNEQCKQTASTATQTAFQELVSSNAEFDFICDT